MSNKPKMGWGSWLLIIGIVVILMEAAGKR